MVAFAGERVLELEAPIRNEGTKATLAGWGRTQDDVECGRRSLEPAMVRECFEYLFSKVSHGLGHETRRWVRLAPWMVYKWPGKPVGIAEMDGFDGL